MGSKGKGSNSKPKAPMRRRSQSSRRALQDCIVNMAEARREIVQALQLHRSATSRAAAAAATALVATTKSTAAAAASECYYYSVTESMPFPEPIWSTTAPTVTPSAPAPSTSAAVARATTRESLEFEWGDQSHAAAYHWWRGFLKTLDCENNHKNNVELYSRVVGYQDSEISFVDTSHHHQQNGTATSTAPDEWLMIPTGGDQQGDQTATSP